MLLEKSGEITPETMKRQSQNENNSPAAEVTDDGSKVRCCKEQYCMNIRSMNQGKLEMGRVNVDILGTSELKWTRMGKFNSNEY